MDLQITGKKEFYINKTKRFFLLGIIIFLAVLIVIGFFIEGISDYNRIFTFSGLIIVSFNYFTQAKKPLIAIEQDHLIFPELFKNKIVKFDELQEVYYAAGDYVFKIKEKEYRVIKSLIDKNQVEEFDALFKELSK